MLEDKIQKTKRLLVLIFSSDSMLWIKEVEMVDSLEELKSSRSIEGKDFPNFEMLDARIVSALNKIIPNSHFRRRSASRGAESPQRRSVFHEEDRSPS